MMIDASTTSYPLESASLPTLFDAAIQIAFRTDDAMLSVALSGFLTHGFIL